MEIKVFVDWDNDGFINKGVPTGAPPNLVPYAAFPRAAAFRHYDTGAYETDFLYDSRYGLVKRVVDLLTGEKTVLGGQIDAIYNPTETPNLIDGWELRNINYEAVTSFVSSENGRLRLSPLGTTIYIGGLLGIPDGTISVGAGTYTFLFRYVPADASSNSLSWAVARSVDGSTSPVVLTNQAEQWTSLTFTSSTNQDVSIAMSGASGTLYTTGFMLLLGTYSTPPDGFNVWGVSPIVSQPAVVLQSGKAYYTRFMLNGNANVTIRAYLMDRGSTSYTLYDTTVLAVTSETKYELLISTLAATKELYFTLEVDADTSLEVYGYGIFESAVALPFSVGKVAAYDALSVLDATWSLGKRKYNETLPYEGEAELTLNNSTKLYSPQNPNSPLFGYFDKNLRCDIELDGVVVWRGWTHTFDVVVGTNSNQQARFVARQGMFRLREGTFRPLVRENYRVDELIPELLDMSGWRGTNHPVNAFLNFNIRLGYNSFLPDDDGFYARKDTGLFSYDLIGGDWSEKTTIETAIKDALEAEQYSFWIGRDGRLNLVNRNFYLYHPSQIDEVLTLGLQAATYEYGRDLLTTVEVFAKPRDSVSNAIIWQSQPAIEVERGSSLEVRLDFLFEEGSNKTITAVSDEVDVIGYYQSRLRGVVPDEVLSAADLEKINVQLLEDGTGRYRLTIANGLTKRVWLEISLYGDYLVGGDGLIYEVVDLNAMRENNVDIREKIESPLISSAEEANSVAQALLIRNSEAKGEFTSISAIGSNPYVIGQKLLISEAQTGEVQKPHVIIGEDVSYSGNVLTYKYNLAYLDNHDYLLTGDEIKGELNTIIEQPQIIQSLGVGYTDSVINLDSIRNLDTWRVPRYTQSRLGVGLRQALAVEGTPNNTLRGDYETYPVQSNQVVFGVNGKATIPVKAHTAYRFVMYVYSTLVQSPTLSIIGSTYDTGTPTLDIIDNENGGTANFSYTTITAQWVRIEGYFYTEKSGSPVNAIALHLGSNSVTPASFQYWEKYPTSYLAANTDYTVQATARIAGAYTEKDVTLTVVAVDPPPYVSGDGDTVLATVNATLTTDGMLLFSGNFTTDGDPHLVRVELEFDTIDPYDRLIEVLEIGIREGSVTEQGTLYTENTKRLAP